MEENKVTISYKEYKELAYKAWQYEFLKEMLLDDAVLSYDKKELDGRATRALDVLKITEPEMYNCTFEELKKGE